MQFGDPARRSVAASIKDADHNRRKSQIPKDATVMKELASHQSVGGRCVG